MQPWILRVNVAGQALGWMDWQDAVLMYAKDRVVWTAGEVAFRIHGGVNRFTGQRSHVDVHPVVASAGAVYTDAYEAVPPLTNRALFRRDRYTCMYCLAELPEGRLTRDHVMPLSKGGRDVWTNVVTACLGCNQAKGNKSLREAGLTLHAVPFAPSYAEWLILHNRRILADQMAFLRT